MSIQSERIESWFIEMSNSMIFASVGFSKFHVFEYFLSTQQILTQKIFLKNYKKHVLILFTQDLFAFADQYQAYGYLFVEKNIIPFAIYANLDF